MDWARVKEMSLFDLEEAAELADVKPTLLRLWLETGKFKTLSGPTKMVPEQLFGPLYFFTEDDIPRLVAFAATQVKRKPAKSEPFIDDGTQDNFTVAQIASMWQLSTDTIQRMFQDEAGVLPLGNKSPRGKRRRITLRIPREVMERVKKRRSNA
jgi:hypothetical protein